MTFCRSGRVGLTPFPLGRLTIRDLTRAHRGGAKPSRAGPDPKAVKRGQSGATKLSQVAKSLMFVHPTPPIEGLVFRSGGATMILGRIVEIPIQHLSARDVPGW